MNPPGKALKRGSSYSAGPAGSNFLEGQVASPAGELPVRPAMVQVDDWHPKSQVAPIFRILSLLLLVVGGFAILVGIVAVKASMTAVYAGIGCLFWAALMYAIAEALTRLAEISMAVRKMAEK